MVNGGALRTQQFPHVGNPEPLQSATLRFVHQTLVVLVAQRPHLHHVVSTARLLGCCRVRPVAHGTCITHGGLRNTSLHVRPRHTIINLVCPLVQTQQRSPSEAHHGAQRE